MEEYIKHIRKTKTHSYCGVEINPFEWVFTDPEHAELTVSSEGRLLSCDNCLEEIRR